MNLVQRAKDVLSQSSGRSSGCAPFRAGLAALEAGDGTAAGAALAPLSDPAAFVATMVLERHAVRMGKVDLVASVGDVLTARLESRAVDSFMILANPWEAGWTADCGDHLAPARRTGQDQQGGFAAHAQLQTVRDLLASGPDAFERAHAIAAEIHPYNKEKRGQALALLGLHAPDPKQGKTLLTDAVKAAKARPQIQDGGEEAEALGEVLKVFAEGGLDAEHAAVKACVKGLDTLGKTYKRRDVRSYGVRIGALAAAARAGRDGDQAWLAIAEGLHDRIWTDTLTWPLRLQFAMTAAASGDTSAAEKWLDSIEDETFVAHRETLFPAHADALLRAWSGRDTEVTVLALLKDAGVDISAALEARVEKNSGSYNRQHSVYGELLLLAPERAEAHLENVSRGESLGEAAERMWKLESERHRVPGLLKRALNAKWVPQFANREDIEMWAAHPALLEKLERAAARDDDWDDRMRSLSIVAESWAAAGAWDKAIGAIEKGLPDVQKRTEEAWVPYDKRGDRASRVNTPLLPVSTLEDHVSVAFEGDLKAALKEAKKNKSTYTLGAQVARTGNLDDLAAVRAVHAKMPKGRGDDAVGWRSGFVLFDIALGDFDAALATIDEMKQCRIYQVGPGFSAAALSTWLAETEGAWTKARAEALLQVVHKEHPQDVPVLLFHMVPRLLAPAPVDAMPDLVETVRGFTRKFRFEGDRACIEAALAWAFAKRGALADGAGCMDAAMALLDKNTTYTKAKHYALAAVALRTAGAEADAYARWLTRIVAIPTGERVYARAQATEGVMRVCWAAGEQAVLGGLIAAEHFPTEVNEAVRRSWIVEAAAQAPQPVDAVLAVWKDKLPSRARATEQIRALAAALDAAGDSATAEKLDALPGCARDAPGA